MGAPTRRPGSLGHKSVLIPLRRWNMGAPTRGQGSPGRKSVLIPLLMGVMAGCVLLGGAVRTLMAQGEVDGRAGSDTQAHPDTPFDLLIRGGRVMDGSGNPWFYADVGIRGDRIAAIGHLAGARAHRVIDASGRLVVPGFIDIHTHVDEPGSRTGIRSEDPRRRAVPNFLAQGVTTVVTGHCGRSPLPIADQRSTLEELGTGPNVIMLVGHGSVRGEVMGRDVRRPATEEEVGRMRELVRQGMMDGAWGLSAGLEYNPGIWSTTDEVVDLVEEIVPWRGVYMSHQRAEGADPMWYWPSQDEPGPPNLMDAVLETIEIGERTGATVVAAHVKAKGVHYWGTSGAIIQLIEGARQRGVDIWADQYPYNTTGTDGNTVLIPGWAFGAVPPVGGGGPAGEGGETTPDTPADQIERVLGDPALAADLRRDMAHEIRRRGGPENVVVFEHPRPEYVGLSLAEVMALEGLSPVDAALSLQANGDRNRRGGARLRGFSLSELDLDTYARQPWVATASDAGVALPGTGSVHARFYGTFVRKIRHYALDRGVITLEHAIRSSTSLPAQILGLQDRGTLREGAYADLAVIDLDRVRDAATFFEPHQYAEGVDYVLINGEMVVDGGELTWKLPGRVLTPEGSGRPRF
jgi:N-acyl-D-amino-acid deacylase